MFFLKNLKDKARRFLLVKNMGKEFSFTGIWSNTDHSSSKLRAVDLAILFYRVIHILS